MYHAIREIIRNNKEYKREHLQMGGVKQVIILK